MNVGDGKTGKHYTTFTQQKDQRYPGNAVSPLPFTDDFNDNDVAGFFQDTWKVRPNLTVNWGLRYDVQLFPPLPNPNTSTPLLTLYTSHLNIDYSGIQPRLGVAWNLAKNTVLRAGGGFFYAKTTSSAVSAVRRTSGTREQQYNCTPSTCVASLTFPNVLYYQQLSGAPASLPIAGVVQPTVLNPPGDNCTGNPTCGVRGILPDTVRPSAYEAEVSFERQLPGNIGLTASYIFTRGIHLPSHFDINLAPNTVSKSSDVVDTAGVTQLVSTVPFFTKAPGKHGGGYPAGGFRR